MQRIAVFFMIADMSYPHVIRLRGPWEYRVLSCWRQGAGRGWAEETDDLPPPGRVKLPNDWGGALGPAYRGRVRYARHFNLPTGLGSRERVSLVADGADARADVALNAKSLGKILGYALPASFDITELLEPRNELLIDVELPPLGAGESPPRPGREDQPGGLIREVRLEIRSRLWLDDLCLCTVQVDSGATLQLSGTVRGERASAPLNVLVTVEGREWHFGSVEPNGRIDITKTVDNLPMWTPGTACELATIDVKLLQRGEAVWESSCPTAYRPLFVEQPAPALPHGSVVLDEVLPDEQYLLRDRLGQPIVKQVPVAWSGIVCPRLAHHPSIVAWITPAEELARLSSDARKDYCGRPWLPREAVCPANVT